MGVYQIVGKRLFDMVVSIFFLVVLFPLLIVVALLIKLDSPGPVFFIQDRMGKGGRNFRLMKFRTMYVDKVEESKFFAPGSTMRITRCGKILRDTKIDELPQLINVLKGEMSFVGPRPEVSKYRHVYRGMFEQVLTLKPGITDWASIKYRNEEELLCKSGNPEVMYEKEVLPDKLKMAVEYKKEIGFMNDMKILITTLLRVIR
ncbi:MAG: sugar transferase [Deltaproteobacteria bacterium]|nr:sugar transferase [Deltaproteobacteria bacterium]